MPKILIAASGTGGHLFPALSVAKTLPKNWKVFWLGVKGRMEREIIGDHFPLKTIDVEGLRGSLFNRVAQCFNLFRSTIVVIQFIQKEGIHLVFTTGGYIAAPAILAAKFCGIKVLIHESNAYPGKVTRLLGRFCDLVALGVEPAKQYLGNCKTVITGTPVREEFLFQKSLPDWVPNGEGPLLLVMGGSQGAVQLNVMVRYVLPKFLNQGCRVVHLIGKNDKPQLRHVNIVERAFSDEVPALLAHSDLVISRSGASALSEIAFCGIPSILVPYPYATDNHQEFNAAYAAESGGALILHQSDTNHIRLEKILDNLLGNRLLGINESPELLKDMKKCIKQLQLRDSTKEIVRILITLS